MLWVLFFYVYDMVDILSQSVPLRRWIALINYVHHGQAVIYAPVRSQMYGDTESKKKKNHVRKSPIDSVAWIECGLTVQTAPHLKPPEMTSARDGCGWRRSNLEVCWTIVQQTTLPLHRPLQELADVVARFIVYFLNLINLFVESFTLSIEQRDR